MSDVDENIILKPQRKESQIESDWNRELRAVIAAKAEVRVAKVTLCARLGVCNETTKTSSICKREMSVKCSHRSYEECKIFSKSLESLERHYEDEILILDDHIKTLRLQFKRKNAKD